MGRGLREAARGVGGPVRRGRAQAQDAHRADGEVRCGRSRRSSAAVVFSQRRVALRGASGRRLAGQRCPAGRAAGEARRQRLDGGMLRIGLTGGIGAGKSTVSAAFAECGGIIVDGDVIAREVVEPGTEGLSQLVEAFGEDILLPDGALNRPALAARAFVDDEHRATLNGIVHPLVGKRRQEIIDAVHDDAVVVEDIPLLVETGMAPAFPLVVVVTADEETRVERLIKRGMDEADARARIKAQAPEEQRRAIADVLLDNSGTPGELVDKARDLWYNRVLLLAHNIRKGRCAPSTYQLVPYNTAWPDDAR